MGKDIAVLKFRFSPQKREPKQYVHHYSKLIQGVCVRQDDGQYRMLCKLNESDNVGLSVPLTEDSFDLSRREIVFDAEPDADGIKTMYIRHEDSRERKFSPGLRTQYCTVAEGRVFNGYLVRVNGTLKFKLNDYVKKHKDG